MLLSIRNLLWSELPLARCFEAESSPIVINPRVWKEDFVMIKACDRRL